MGTLLDFDPAVFGMRAIVLPDMIEMGEFGAIAAEIVPDAGKNGRDLRGRFFRKGGRQIGTGGLVFACKGTEQSCKATEQIGGLDRIEIANAAQQSDRQRAQRCVAERLGRVANAGPGAEQEPAHQKYTMILPNTCRLSMRLSAVATSSIGTSVSITGSMPSAILSRLSATFRMVAPNDPKIRYCCWKSCIRLMVVVGPDVEPQVTSRPPRFSVSSEPLKVSAPTCSNTTSTPFFLVILRVSCSKRSFGAQAASRSLTPPG